MKNNKFFLIFSIIFFLQGINIAAGEEIIFEASQINLYENGTLIKANKGKAIIDNNNEIIANKFEYNKETKILIATGNVVVFDALNNIVTKSNKIIWVK